MAMKKRKKGNYEYFIEIEDDFDKPWNLDTLDQQKESWRGVHVLTVNSLRKVK